MTSDSALISFVGTFLDNPFYYIFGSDFTGISTNEYELDNEKVSQLFSKFCYFMSVGLKGVPSVNTFTMDDDGNFSKFYFEPEDRKVGETDTISQSSLYYIIHQSVTFDVLKIGDTLIDHLTPVKKDGSSANSALKSAFSKFNEKKITITVRDDATSNSTTTSSTNKFFFDGKNAYVKYFNDYKVSESELNSANDYMLRVGEDVKHYEAYGYDDRFGSWEPSNSTKFGKLNQDSYVYNDLIPIVNTVSSELFTFDKTTNLYKLDKDYLSGVFGYTLTPVFKEVRSNNILNASSLSLKLDNSGNLSSAIIKYSYYDSSFNSYSGTVYVNYSNQGSTVIPFSALDNLGGNK